MSKNELKKKGKDSKKNLLSLFAGVGGLDLGLEMAGFNTICANELEHYACESLRKNKILSQLNDFETESFIEEASKQRCFRLRGDKQMKEFFNRLKSKGKSQYLQNAQIIEGDVRAIDSNTFKTLIGERDLFAIAGGPPCQPFSKAGKQKSLDCTKNGDLFFEFVRLARDLRPKWFLFENVKGIVSTKTDVLYLACKKCGNKWLAPFEIRQDWKLDISPDKNCIKCNSNTLDWIVTNEPGGSLKIILNEFEKIGYKCNVNILNAADFGAPQIRERLFIVGSIDDIKFEWPEPTHVRTKDLKVSISLFSEYDNKTPWVSMYDAIWSNGHPTFGKLDQNKSVLWVKNIVRPHDEPVTWSLNRPSPTIGAHQGAKLALAPNGVPESQIFRQQWHTKGNRQGDTAPVPVKHEYLSDEELLKLQTFPSWWYLHGTRMQRAFQVGNAVPPLLAYHVGKAILNADSKNDH
jgi:DNA (cytosine-5)-methyltransferase 1